MDNLEKLKFNLREEQVPFFSDDELRYLLEKNDNNVESASYEGLIMKAETTGLNVSGLTTKDSSSYFKMLAANHIKTNSGTLL